MRGEGRGRDGKEDRRQVIQPVFRDGSVCCDRRYLKVFVFFFLSGLKKRIAFLDFLSLFPLPPLSHLEIFRHIKNNGKK